MIQDRDDVPLRMFDPPMLNIRVDRHDDGSLVALADIIDEMTERYAEEVADVQSDDRFLLCITGISSSRDFEQ